MAQERACSIIRSEPGTLTHQDIIVRLGRVQITDASVALANLVCDRIVTVDIAGRWTHFLDAQDVP